MKRLIERTDRQFILSGDLVENHIQFVGPDVCFVLLLFQTVRVYLRL
jgi:hypothetical protein